MKASNIFKSLIGIAALVMSMNTTYGQQLAFAADPQAMYNIHEKSAITPTNPGLRVGLKTLEEKEKIQLLVYNKEERKLNISLSSENQELWSMNSREAYLSRILNLASLEDGSYVLEINNGKTKITKKLLLRSKIKTEKNIQID